jgi:hypothetical protein
MRKTKTPRIPAVKSNQALRQIFELQGDPLIVADDFVLMDAMEKKVGAVEAYPHTPPDREHGERRSKSRLNRRQGRQMLLWRAVYLT